MSIRVADLAGCERFYRAALSELGNEPTGAGEGWLQWDDFALLAAGSGHPPTRNLHIGFVAPSREHVDAFWRAGIDAGGDDDGAPGERPQYTPGYYGGFLRDPAGNSAEAVVHPDVRRGGNVDHLWIGVADVDSTYAFYATMAPHTGLREGRRWEHGRQLRGAWATFSLVCDGRAPTENAHVAFPAPDRRAVEDFHAAATRSGARDDGAPAEHPEVHLGYYGARVLDPAGARVESVFRGQARAGRPPRLD